MLSSAFPIWWAPDGGNFRRHFVSSSFALRPRKKCARVSHEMAQSQLELKIAHLANSMNSTPLLEKISSFGVACSAGAFGRAKAACLCSYCCNRHLCYDGGRLGRVKIPAPFDSPHFLPSIQFSTCAFASLKKTPVLQASFGVLPRLWLLLCTNPGFETGIGAICKWPIWKTFAIFDKMMFIVQAIAGRMDGNREAIGDEVALAQRFL